MSQSWLSIVERLILKKCSNILFETDNHEVLKWTSKYVRISIKMIKSWTNIISTYTVVIFDLQIFKHTPSSRTSHRLLGQKLRNISFSPWWGVNCQKFGYNRKFVFKASTLHIPEKGKRSLKYLANKPKQIFYSDKLL